MIDCLFADCQCRTENSNRGALLQPASLLAARMALASGAWWNCMGGVRKLQIAAEAT